MRVLVLGSTGFLGSHIAGALARHERVALIRHVRRIKAPSGACDNLGFDLTDGSSTALAEFLRSAQADVIINAVGWIGRDEVMLNRLNDQLVQRLVHAISTQAPRTRFLHLGSAAEYGPGPVGVAVSESAEPRPTTSYGRSKLAGTLRVVEAAEGGEVDAMVLRVFNPIGAGMPAGALPADAAVRFAAAVAKGAPAVHFGNLADHRDFVDANDVAEAVLAAAVARDVPSRILNVGSGTATLVRDLVRAIAAMARYGGAIVEDDDGSHRSSDVSWQAADISRAVHELGWRPVRPLSASLGVLFASVSAP